MRSVMMPSTPRSSKWFISVGSSIVHTCTCSPSRWAVADEPPVDHPDPAVPHRHLRGDHRRRQPQPAARRGRAVHSRATSRVPMRGGHGRAQRARGPGPAGGRRTTPAGPGRRRRRAGSPPPLGPTAGSSLTSMLNRTFGQASSTSSSRGTAAAPPTRSAARSAQRTSRTRPGRPEQPVERVVVEHHHHPVGGGVHVGLQVAVAQVDRPARTPRSCSRHRPPRRRGGRRPAGGASR